MTYFHHFFMVSLMVSLIKQIRSPTNNKTKIKKMQRQRQRERQRHWEWFSDVATQWHCWLFLTNWETPTITFITLLKSSEDLEQHQGKFGLEGVHGAHPYRVLQEDGQVRPPWRVPISGDQVGRYGLWETAGSESKRRETTVSTKRKN